jgi:hypothetical protein
MKPSGGLEKILVLRVNFGIAFGLKSKFECSY